MLVSSHLHELTGVKMAGSFRLTFQDWSREKSPFRVTTATPNAASLDSWNTAIGDLKSALAGITSGTFNSEERSALVDLLNSDPPTDDQSQRERKWLVTYKGDTSEKVFRCEIPTADTAGKLLANSDEADPADTFIAAFITAFEALAKSPDNGTESVTVLSLRSVGRNI